MAEFPEVEKEKVQFIGNQGFKQEAIELLDKVLREQCNLGAYGDLSKGLEELKKECNIKIIDKDNHYEIDIYPSSGKGGHDFSFTIDKKSGKRSDVVVGEILPEPDIEE